MTTLFRILPIGVLALGFGCWAIWWGARSVFEGYVSSTWPQTTGTIQESRIDSFWSSIGTRGGGRTGHAPVVIYTYTVDGRSYRGSKIDTRGTWNYKSSRQIVDAFPLGSQRAVYYSPANPENSILIVGVHRSSFFGLVLGMLILSFGTLFGTLGYLAPKYGHSASGRYYTFDKNSPVMPITMFGIFAIMCQFGLLFWISR